MNKLKKLLERCRKDYKTWEPIYCPALGSEVHFNANGFKHLRFHTDSRRRTAKETSHKLKLLPSVKNILQNATCIAEYREVNMPRSKNQNMKTIKIQYWSLEDANRKNGSKIRIILRKVGNGKIHFWSVMGLH